MSGENRKKHNGEIALFWGPFMDMFYNSISYNNGLQREAAWMLAAPVFAQSSKNNYLAEALCHLTNIVCVWPPFIRDMMRQNCSVNISGKSGHNIALDEFVETYVIKPLKMYASGHTSMQVLTNLSTALPMLSSIREKNIKARKDLTVATHHVTALQLQSQMFILLCTTVYRTMYLKMWKEIMKGYQ